jgi:DNA-binding PadR family transcriptional regulator
MKTYGPQHAKKQKKKQQLEQKILVYLKKLGPSLYDALSLHFETNHPAEIQPVLRGLKEYGYIDVTRDKMVTITTFGLQQLKLK